MRDLFKKQFVYADLKMTAVNADLHVDFGSFVGLVVDQVNFSVSSEKLLQSAVFHRHNKFVLGLVGATEASDILPCDARLPLGAFHEA